MLLLGFHGTTKKNLYPKLSNKKWAPPCGWCPFLSPRAYVWVKKYSLCTGTPDFRANERDIRPNKST